MSRLCDNASSQAFTLSATPVSAVPLTIAGWVYLDESITMSVFGISDTAGIANYFQLEVRPQEAGGVKAWTSDAGGAFEATSTTTMGLNTWAHVAGVWTSASSRAAFLNGGGKGTNASASTPAGLDNTTIGVLTRSSSIQYTSGRVAEFGLWSVALTDAEVLALARGASPLLVRPQSLVGYWPLLGNTNPEVNLRNAAANMTLVGAPVKARHPRVIHPAGPL